MSVESVGADLKADEEFLEILEMLIEEQDHLLEQIFNMDEISLFWKLEAWENFHKKAKSMPSFRALVDREDNIASSLVQWESRAFKNINTHTASAQREQWEVMDDPTSLPKCHTKLLCQWNLEILFGEWHTFQEFADCW